MNGTRDDGTAGADQAGGRAGTWPAGTPGVLLLPSGRAVRGRGLRHALDPSAPLPTYGVYLLGAPPPEASWETEWLAWPDFRLPRDRARARRVLAEVWERAGDPAERVEVACLGGRGRTGTALACLAVLDGVRPDEAVRFVREGYDRHAVETPWQRRYVSRFPG
ncbi:protein-tyrosine phosphatase family protein [Streptomyces fructofermentans]|uniref:Protein-tyrosine-phosphatase n=1 Tax=Streptomyces fructofermentans TaxID=152141 RepID=A0A918N930_9ACTN|nr:protein-tyrosine phosphatase family protein [Streptomyces fructofermentans]GGX55382.1 protein-tyrosine-phosphatase [Streptomyces fructofermentans]